jgi:hypothetical protein
LFLGDGDNWGRARVLVRRGGILEPNGILLFLIGDNGSRGRDPSQALAVTPAIPGA